MALSDRLQRPSDITLLLEYLAKIAGADGVIFWRLAPGSILTETVLSGRFFPVASWCRFDDISPWYHVPADSITGQAWLERNHHPFKLTHSVKTDETVPEQARRIMTTHWHMDSCAAIPLPAMGDVPSCLTFYRRSSPLERDALTTTAALARQLPMLHSLSADRQALAFLTLLSRKLHPIAEAEGVTSGNEALRFARKCLQEVCDLIAEHFDALEATILLSEEADEHPLFRVQGRHWEWLAAPYSDGYRAGEGLTGWVLKHHAPLQILDLARFSVDEEWIRAKYHDLDWRDLLNVKDQVRLKFDLSECPDEDLPMVSFICVPVTHGTFQGVIRCCMRTRSPLSFDKRDLEMLNLAASYVGDWWKDLLEYLELLQERSQLKYLADSVTRLHRLAGKLLVNEQKSLLSLLSQTLTAAMTAIPGVDHGSIRLIDAEERVLRYKVWEGPLWKKGHFKTDQTFPLNLEEQRSSGARVVKQDRAVIVNDRAHDAWDRNTQRELVRQLFLPIRGGGEVLGVLDLGRTTAQDFFDRDAVVADNFAAQVGLYLHLESELDGRLRMQKRLAKQQEEQIQTFENLRHQIYGPVGTAAMALERLLQGGRVSDPERGILMLARGDALRASIMVRSLELFAALAAGSKPKVKPERLLAKRLSHRLLELASYQNALNRAERRLSFVVNDDAPGWLDTNNVQCDLNLLEHAVSNLLENARKYSARGTKVLVLTGHMNHGRDYFIAVQNSGFRIRSDDVSKMKMREWRGEEAWRTSEGFGIGLYFVNAIMEAHGGRLQITPTNSMNINDVRLVFPVKDLGI